MMPAVPTASVHAKSDDKGRTFETAALASTAWTERWFPDTFSFAVLALALVSRAAMLAAARPGAVAIALSDGLWSLMPFSTTGEPPATTSAISSNVCWRQRPHIVDDAVGARIKSGGDEAVKGNRMPTTVTLISVPNQ